MPYTVMYTAFGQIHKSDTDTITTARQLAVATAKYLKVYVQIWEGVRLVFIVTPEGGIVR